MTRFRREMKEEQLHWRYRSLPEVKGWGFWKRTPYPHLLPRRAREQNLWPGIQADGQFPLRPYLEDKRIKPHSGTHNLLSSWSLSASLYFPFGQEQAGRDLLLGFLRKHVAHNIARVKAVELEYAELPPLDPRTLLGEPGGMRGATQTSPDVAFLVTMADGSRGLVLTEVKYTEHNFYPCSARRDVTPAKRAEVCGNPALLRSSPGSHCYCHLHKNRRYWQHLAGVFQGWHLPQCPAATAGYQLFRQQALAEGLATSGKYSFVASCLAYDARNVGLMRCLRRSGIERVDRDWGPLFRGKSPFAVMTHQDWVEWVRSASSTPAWTASWLEYVEGRYAY